MENSVYVGGLNSQTTLRCLTHLVDILSNSKDFTIAYVSNKEISFIFEDILKKLSLEDKFIREGNILKCLSTGSSVIFKVV